MIEKLQNMTGISSLARSALINNDSFLDKNTIQQDSNLGFLSLLQDMFKDMSSNLREAEAFSYDAMQGKASAREVVDSIIKAERSLQTSIAVRDKLVSAYLEITKMQI
ncbi:flagellar basal body protein [Liberibacter crescens BT-1]|uniref:Flagellar hook-basal body complex protein FliE n=1 Tax=Liberibacter crescens (strain BT-1) TaxID=1215343 RepID=L0EU58_LIBCB|nr:flagellar hook-basal body complex protein FliE [Liberibacter crescens]AGA64193.1 flagellar basal body protein [Liberibacter crescens BT-1]AMC12450.1 hypothetical protein RL73_01175 [Liberibacter crescens]